MCVDYTLIHEVLEHSLPAEFLLAIRIASYLHVTARKCSWQLIGNYIVFFVLQSETYCRGVCIVQQMHVLSLGQFYVACLNTEVKTIINFDRDLYDQII